MKVREKRQSGLFSKHPKVALLAIILGAAVACLLLSFLLPSPSTVRDLAVNLAASFIVIGITVLVFERLEALVRASEWREVRRFALESLWRVSNVATSHPLSSFGISIIDPESPDIYSRSLRTMDDLLAEIAKRNIGAEIFKFQSEQWKDLTESINIVASEVSDHLANYSQSLNPRELAAVLAVKSELRVVLLFLDAVTAPVADPAFRWPDGGAESSYFTTQTSALARGLEDYFKAVVRLRSLKIPSPRWAPEE